MQLVGERVTLRDWTPQDAERLTWLLDHTRPWHCTNGPYFGLPDAEQSAQQAQNFLTLASTPTRRLPHPRGMLGIEDRDSATLIGAVSWYWESEQTDWRRLGIGIHDESYWGRGLATEAFALWTSYLFESTDALRLDFATYSGNPGMLAVGRRLGFVEEGRFRKARRWSGGVHDSVVMGLLREEWEQFRASWPTASVQ